MRALTFLTIICIAAVVAGACAHAASDTAGSATTTKGGAVAKHELPPLPYSCNALEPYYDEATVRIHHDVHHLGYVKGLNRAEEKLAEARATGDYSSIQYWERQLAFNGAGDVLHTMFWRNMAPNAGGEPRTS